MVLVPVGLVALAIGLGIVLGVRSSRPSAEVAPPTATTETTTSSAPTRTAPASAKDLFGHTCASCHTLAAAGATGGIGPNLDTVTLTRQQVRNQIRVGSLSGAMPANLLQGDEAERVAAFVAKNAGTG